jgi:hypothetical protein
MKVTTAITVGTAKMSPNFSASSTVLPVERITSSHFSHMSAKPVQALHPPPAEKMRGVAGRQQSTMCSSPTNRRRSTRADPPQAVPRSALRVFAAKGRARRFRNPVPNEH